MESRDFRGIPDITFTPQNVNQSYSNPPKTSKINGKKTALVLGIFVLLLVLVGIGFIMALRIMKKEYTVVGEWKSRDLQELPDMLQNILEEEGYEMTGMLIDMMEIDTLGEDVSLIFTESKKILITVNSIALGTDFFTYELLENDKILLNFEWTGSILGTKIPISFGYTGTYEVDEDYLKIDFFGYELMLDRYAEDIEEGTNL